MINMDSWNGIDMFGRVILHSEDVREMIAIEIVEIMNLLVTSIVLIMSIISIISVISIMSVV